MSSSPSSRSSSPSSFPSARSRTWTVDDVRFDSGEVLPSLSLHYHLLGNPDDPAVLVLHGTGGSASQLLSPRFGGVLFGPGGPLDASRHFVILPDAIGHGRSAKPSDGLRMRFPRYTYDDMVALQYRLVTEALRLSHLKLVLGVSMGGMHAWRWAVRYPRFMDAVVPLSCQPGPMSGRNWLMRKLMVDAVRSDPQWRDGDYVDPPPSLRVVSLMFGVAMNGGAQGMQRMAPDREQADRWLARQWERPPSIDANDFIRQWEASRDYDPSGELDRIEARVLSIVSEDDERLLVRDLPGMLARVRRARLFVIPEGPRTAGHGTVGDASLWVDALSEFLNRL
ncbi:MAG: alpha/beta fold hydrolase [Burkholderiaceae bacterium]